MSLENLLRDVKGLARDPARTVLPLAAAAVMACGQPTSLESPRVTEVNVELDSLITQKAHDPVNYTGEAYAVLDDERIMNPDSVVTFFDGTRLENLGSVQMIDVYVPDSLNTEEMHQLIGEAYSRGKMAADTVTFESLVPGPEDITGRHLPVSQRYEPR